MLFSSKNTQSETSLYRYFHEFHDELVALKQSPDLGKIQQQLKGLLNKQSTDANQRGGELHAKLYREAQYLMVALADEVFLHLDWEGKETWRTQLLEAEIFNSQAAGQKVFDNLKALLAKRDPYTQDLARLYLITLALGFQGKYRGITDEKQSQELINYRHQLFFFVTEGHSAEELYKSLYLDPDKRLFPDTYKYTMKHRQEKRQWLPSQRMWYWIFTMIGGVLLLISIVVWDFVSEELDQKTAKILKTDYTNINK